VGAVTIGAEIGAVVLIEADGCCTCLIGAVIDGTAAGGSIVCTFASGRGCVEGLVWIDCVVAEICDLPVIVLLRFSAYIRLTSANCCASALAAVAVFD